MEANRSPERRDLILNMLTGIGMLKWQQLSHDGQIMYVVGALVATDKGHIDQESLDRGMASLATVDFAKDIIIQFELGQQV